jgi:hypothetical protein
LPVLFFVAVDREEVMVEQQLQLELAVFIRTYFGSGVERDVGTGGTGRLGRLAAGRQSVP